MTRAHYLHVLELRQQGLSTRQIAEKSGVAKSVVQRWLITFAGENPAAMSQYNKRPRRVIERRAPEVVESSAQNTSSPNVESAKAETDTEKIARLERELRDANMRADLYNEIINVAEKKFDIQIRKKAGTKQ